MEPSPNHLSKENLLINSNRKHITGYHWNSIISLLHWSSVVLTLKFCCAYIAHFRLGLSFILNSIHFRLGHPFIWMAHIFARDIPSKKKQLTPAGLKSYKLLLVISVSPEMCVANLETKMKSALRWSSENYKRSWEFELPLLTGGEVLEIKYFN